MPSATTSPRRSAASRHRAWAARWDRRAWRSTSSTSRCSCRPPNSPHRRQIASVTMGFLAGRTALVSGGGRGQGRSHALALAAEGADVVVCDIAEDVPTVPYHLSSQADLDETVARIEALDRRAIGLVADMRSTEQVNQVVTTAISEFGRIDILVANQGIISHAPVDGTTDEVWDNIIATNLTGIFKLTRAVLPYMRERGYGRIVATASSI